MQRAKVFENRFFLFVFIVFFACTTLSPGSVAAAKRALLIGIGRYPHLSKRHQLEGPAYYVVSFKDALTGLYGFPKENVTILLDNEAGKKEILGALDCLIEETRDGDSVYIYYSGHGTSAYDQRNRWQISPYTGALVPSDFNPQGTPAELMDNLIVGSRDIRPRLLRLESGSKVFVIIDACHSGLTVRSTTLAPGAKYRYVDIDSARRGKKPIPWDPSLEKLSYPYSNTIYFAASSTLEKAQDITTAALDHGLTTVDGKPHGSFSNALLNALAGRADANRDSVLFIDEVFSSVRREVVQGFNHTPQLLKPKGMRIDLPFLQRGEAERVAQKVFPERGQQSEGTGGKQGYGISSPNIQELLRLVEANTARFELSVTTDPASGVMVEGTLFDINIETAEKAYVLLLGITSKGEISVIYPWSRDEMVPVESDDPLNLAEIGVITGPDFGKEHLLALGFRKVNPLLEHLPERLEKKSGDASLLSSTDGMIIEDLLEMAQKKEISAFSIVSLTTCRKSEIVRK